MKFADMDCDGWLDLFVTNGMTGDYLNSDLVAANPGGGPVHQAPPKPDRDMAFRNAGAGAGGGWSAAFENTGKTWGLDREGISFGAALGDLDADGDPDLVVNSFDEACTVYENGTPVAEAGRLVVRLRGVHSNRAGLGARVILTAGGIQQTREISSARGFFSSDEPVAFFGLGKARAERLEVRWPSGRVQILTGIPAGPVLTLTESGDIPPMEKTAPRLFRSSDSLPVPHQESGFDDFAVQPLLPNRLSRQGPGHGWADVDGDGDFDLFQRGAAGSAGRLVFNGGPDETGQPRFSIKSTAPFDADAACEDMGVLFLDADGDGDDDLYVVSGGVEAAAGTGLYQDRLDFNDGKGTFMKAPAGTLPEGHDSGSCVCTADFDHDGDLDLFVGGRVNPGKYPTSPASRLLRNDGGKFSDTTAGVAPALASTPLVTAALWADLDQDSWPELVLASEWGTVQIFQNTKGRLTLLEKAAGALTGWWNSLAAADLDGDGRLDLIAGNYGLNTKYHPSPGHPAVIYYGDFDDSGHPQVVEAKTLTDGTVLPVRGKSCSQAAMPILRSKFPKFHDFASSDLSGIYTEDVDGDGDSDVVLAQNPYSPQRETGNMDGGLSLLLQNDGARKFSTFWPDLSGIAVAADAKSHTSVPLSGTASPALYFGVNHGTSQMFLPEAAASPQTGISLRGARGNPHAIGASLTSPLTISTVL